MQILVQPTPVSSESIQDTVASLLQAGTNVTLTYNDVANTLTISASSTTDTEAIQDLVSAMFPDSPTIDFSYNDTSGVITANVITASITENHISLVDVASDNADTSKHGFLPKLSGNTTTFLRGDGTWVVPPSGTSYTDEQAQDAVGAALTNTTTIQLVYNDAANVITANVVGGSINETHIDLSDVTTDNATSAKHGFLPKLNNNAAQYLDGTGAWSTPAGGSGAPTDGARVRRTAAQSITQSTLTPISYDIEDVDQSEYFTSGNPTRLTVPRTGWYVIAAQVAWNSNTSGIREIHLRVNGTDFRVSDKVPGSAQLITQLATGVVYLTIGNYIEIVVQHTTTAALNVTESIATISYLGTGATGAGPTTEEIQDIVGGMLLDSATVDFTYDDTAGTITAIASTPYSTFVALTDTPDYVGNALKILRANAAQNALEYGPVLGTMAQQNANAVVITGGTVDGLTSCRLAGALVAMYANGMAVYDAAGNDRVGFYSGVNTAGGTGRYAFCGGGTAPSYFGGTVQVVGQVGIGVAPQANNALSITPAASGFGAAIYDSSGNNVFGYWSNIAARTGCYALYMNGNAPSYFGGAVQVAGTMDVGGTPGTPQQLCVQYPRNTRHAILIRPSDSDSGANCAINFTNVAVTQVGSISTTASSTAYNTTSDVRLKHSTKPLTNVLDCIRALRPISYLWNADDSYGEGFLAHELMLQIPLAVTGEPNEINEDGSIRPQQVDHSKLVPRLTAGLQEALGLMELLTARVASLEAQLAARFL